MVWSAVGSFVHMWALAIGTCSLFLRERRLGVAPLDKPALERMLAADNWWGIAAILWIGSGLARLLYLEKSREFYYRNGFFWVKLGLFAVAMLLELWPMTMFIIWRVRMAQGKPVDTARAPTFQLISRLELVVIALIPVAAALMARGLWLF
jgi:putative membrane protein